MTEVYTVQWLHNLFIEHIHDLKGNNSHLRTSLNKETKRKKSKKKKKKIKRTKKSALHSSITLWFVAVAKN